MVRQRHILISLLVLFIFLIAFTSQSDVYYSPKEGGEKDEEFVGCAFQQEGKEENNNCVANSRALMNVFLHEGEEGVSLSGLTGDLTDCIQKGIKGRYGWKKYDPVVDGVPLEDTDIADECKEQIMAGLGIIELLREHSNRYGGSPFVRDCPPKGQPFIVTMIGVPQPNGKRGGHSVMCEFTNDDWCIPDSGAAKMTCHGHPDQQPEEPGSYTVTINSAGYITSISVPGVGSASGNLGKVVSFTY